MKRTISIQNNTENSNEVKIHDKTRKNFKKKDKRKVTPFKDNYIKVRVTKEESIHFR